MAVVSTLTLKGYFNEGDVPSENNYIDLVDTLANRVINCSVRRSTAQTMTKDQWTTISYNFQEEDSDEMWSIGDPTKFYAQTTGYYVGTASVGLEGITSGIRCLVSVLQNGEKWISRNGAWPASTEIVYVSVPFGPIFMEEGDYLEVVLFHDYSVDRDTLAATSTHPDYNSFCMGMLG